MATKTAVQNMAQAGADLLAIKGAIEGEGVEIASATPTSNYAGLITNNLVKPTGTLNITENGEGVNVSAYAAVNVAVPLQEFVTETYTVTEGAMSAASVTIDGDVVATIPDGVTSIGNDVFKNNTFITAFIIPATVAAMGTDVFTGCTGVTDIYFGGTQAEWEAITGLSGAGVPAGATLHYEYTPV